MITDLLTTMSVNQVKHNTVQHSPSESDKSLLQQFLNPSVTDQLEEPGILKTKIFNLLQKVFSEYKEDEDLNKYAVLLRTRRDVLCQKFIDKTKKRLKKSKKCTIKLTDMINVDLEVDQLKNIKSQNFGSLEEYVASLNLNEEVYYLKRLWKS